MVDTTHIIRGKVGVNVKVFPFPHDSVGWMLPLPHKVHFRVSYVFRNLADLGSDGKGDGMMPYRPQKPFYCLG
jgi:hypothetical protein